MTETSEATQRRRVLHILSSVDDATPADAPQILAECGHHCTASPHTHTLLRDASLEHVVVCFDCYMEENR